MATTTPNFGWPVPTSTDLVKDGATAMEALGDAIDTSMVDLKGGTTGQVLAKASSTDMDFSWTDANPGDITGVTAGTGISGGGTSGTVTVTNSMATTITTKGDLVPGTGSGTFARLAAGNNGETLVADSSTSTGLRYTAGNPITNPLINSCFDVWQRSTSIAVSSGVVYTADRWNAAGPASSAYTISRQATNDTTNLPNIQYCARVQRNSGSSVTGTFYFNQPVETANSIPYVGKVVTLSFYARAGANYSAASSILNASVITGTGTDQNYLGTYTNGTSVGSLAATLTTTWQRFSFQATIGTSATEFTIPFTSTATGTAGANDYFEVTGVQVDIGSVALPVRRNAATIQGELAACCYYYRIFGAGCNGINEASTALDYQFIFDGGGMRTAPAISLYSSSANNFNWGIGNTAYTISSISGNTVTNRGGYLSVATSNSSISTVGKVVTLLTNNFAASAEL